MKTQSELTLLVAEMLYKSLKKDIKALQFQVDEIRNKPSGIESFAYADLPVGTTYRVAFVTNGRKTGEGAGLGTGVPAWRDPVSGTWYSFMNGLAVVI